MKRRRAIQTLAAAAAALPLLRVSLDADELTADQVFVLRDIAGTVLPSAIGRKGQDAAVEQFLTWIRDYKEGVALSHGYGEPRLVKSGPTPAPGYATKSPRCSRPRNRAAAASARCRSNIRRELLDNAFTSRRRPQSARPSRRQARVADLMAHYFRSSGANDLCYNSRIGRNTYRAIRVTTVRPQPLNGGRGL